MNEIDWLTSTDPTLMLEFLSGKVSNRKAILYTVWSCLHCERYSDPRYLDALTLAERFEESTLQERAGVIDRIWQAHDDYYVDDESYEYEVLSLVDLVKGAFTIENAAFSTYYIATQSYFNDVNKIAYPGIADEYFHDLANTIRCLFGNPFRPVTLDPNWLTSTTVGLADAIYNTRAFHDMPILADALEDAGCDDTTVLAHCRAGGEHVRGCWVVDMLLGKS